MFSVFEKYFRGVIFKSFYKIELNSGELAVAEDSMKNKYVRGSLESFFYGALAIPALLFVDTSILASVLIPVTMVSGSAWFSISLVNIRKKFEAFGGELTVDMYRAFVTSLMLLILMTIISMNSYLFAPISELGRNIALVPIISGLLGTFVVFKMIYDVFAGATKYDMNDSMLTGQNEAAEKYFKKSLSLLSSCANRLKTGIEGDVAGYFLGLAFYEVFNFIIIVKGSHDKFLLSLQKADALKSNPPKQKADMVKACIEFIDEFLGYLSNLQDSQTVKSYKNIISELNSLKNNKTESQQVVNIRLATILEEMEDMLTGQGEALFTKRLEIERKFLIKELPKNVDKYPSDPISQGYLKPINGQEVRIRKQGNIYTRTIKENVSADKRQEIEEYLTEDQFNKLWPQTKGKRIEKTRYQIPYQGLLIELDKFSGENDGLIVAEVEFDSENKVSKFKKPSWFDMDVTKESKYKNANLAK